MMRALRLSVVGVAVVLMAGGVLFVGGHAYASWGSFHAKYGFFSNNPGGSCSTGADDSGTPAPPFPPDSSSNCAAGVLPTDNGDAINQSSIVNAGDDVAKADKLISILKADYNGGTWANTGAAYIVQTMLGNGPGSSRTITSAQWTDLQQRLESAASKGYINFSAKINLQNSPYNGVDTYYQRLRDDVAWYSDSDSQTKDGITITNGKSIVYALWYECGNPLGNLPGVPQSPQWTISTSTTSSKTSTTTNPTLGQYEVIPGDTITWQHTIKNNGPDATDQDVAWHYNNSGNISGSGGNWTFGNGSANGKTTTNQSTYSPSDNDLGQQICRSTWAQPKAWNDNGSTESAKICYNVVYRYALTPYVSFPSGLSVPVELGTSTSYALNKRVDNTGSTTSQRNTTWVLAKCTYAPGVDAGTYAGTAAPSGSSLPSNACQQINSGVGPNAGGTFAHGSTTLTPDDQTQPVPVTTAAGTHICYVMSVSPSAWNSGQWVHSAPACMSVTKSPKVQAWGGDIRAGSISVRRDYQIGSKYFGSWAEYGIFGIGAITNMGSNASLAGGSTNDPAADGTLNTLTFANTPSPGYFQPAPAPDGYYNAYYAQRTQPTPAIPYGTVPNGTHEVIYVNGPLEITNNIEYSGSYANPGEIPRVILVVNGDITVDDSVTQIDAWLITQGTLFTCQSDSGAIRKQLTLNDCNQQLTFNGPVNVGDTRLSRTYGADGVNEGDPAEVFNLDPSTFLSSYTASVTQSNIQTVYEKELPPRW